MHSDPNSAPFYHHSITIPHPPASTGTTLNPYFGVYLLTSRCCHYRPAFNVTAGCCHFGQRAQPPPQPTDTSLPGKTAIRGICPSQHLTARRLRACEHNIGSHGHVDGARFRRSNCDSHVTPLCGTYALSHTSVPFLVTHTLNTPSHQPHTCHISGNSTKRHGKGKITW